MTAKQAVLRLYKDMLRDAAQYQSYNYRNYAVRRVRESFRGNKGLTVGSAEQEAAVQAAQEQAAVLRRQVLLSKMYPPETKSILDFA